jgi:hypothetical protein
VIFSFYSNTKGEMKIHKFNFMTHMKSVKALKGMPVYSLSFSSIDEQGFCKNFEKRNV